MAKSDMLFVGIDVACAKGKRIPTVILRGSVDGLALLPLKDLDVCSPRCTGNRAIVLSANEAERIAAEYVKWLEDLQRHFKSSICRIVVDAPSHPRPEHLELRHCEARLQDAGISFIKTPSLSRLEELRTEARAHLENTKSESSLPGANLWWMLVGFELFKLLRARGFVCVESYPQAILKTLGYVGAHKSSAALDQFKAFKLLTRFGGLEEPDLKNACHGSMHDKVDALMCAWLASLPDEEIQLYGESLDDQICVPRLRLR